MDNKKIYISAEMKIVDLSKNDVIRTSGERPGLDLPDIDIVSGYSVIP